MASTAPSPDVIAAGTAEAAPRASGSVLKTAGTLLALTALAPLCAAVVGAALLAGTAAKAAGIARPRPAPTGKTILVSGGKMTKALTLARAFHRAGHRVILTETAKYSVTGHRWSNCVDLFLTVPESSDPSYGDALSEIVDRHGVDVYVPVCSPVSSHYDAAVASRISDRCEVIHLDADLIDTVDDKYQFAQAAISKGLRAPKSVLITDPAQVEAYDFTAQARPFILKSIAYDAVRRLDLTKLPRPTPAETRRYARSLPISVANPWIMQEFIAGTEYCTHGTVRDGQLTVHIACASSAFQVNYAHDPRADMREWVERFVADPPLTGQVSLDFIEADDDGQLYAIECNPRTHSAITLFAGDARLCGAYLNGAGAAIEPAATARPTYWLYHELWRLAEALAGRGSIARRLAVITQGRDAVFDWRDPLPFLMLHHWHIPALLLGDLLRGADAKGWVRIDFNIGKLVQAGGD